MARSDRNSQASPYNGNVTMSFYNDKYRLSDHWISNYLYIAPEGLPKTSNTLYLCEGEINKVPNHFAEDGYRKNKI